MRIILILIIIFTLSSIYVMVTYGENYNIDCSKDTYIGVYRKANAEESSEYIIQIRSELMDQIMMKCGQYYIKAEGREEKKAEKVDCQLCH